MDISLRQVISILIVIALLLFIFNMFISYIFKAQLLNDPCEVCKKNNLKVRNCLAPPNQQDINNLRINITRLNLSALS